MSVKSAACVALGLFSVSAAFAAAPSGHEAVVVENLEFPSHGVTLSGSVAVPAHEEPRAAVVFIHGSGKQTRNLEWRRALPKPALRHWCTTSGAPENPVATTKANRDRKSVV